MNQSELAAYILTRERIVKQIDNIVEHGGSQDTLKRLRRFGNAFSWYPEFYPQILEGVGGMTDKQLMSALRTEDGFMKLIAPVEGLPIHHVFASRTGGDLPLRTPADVFLDVRQRTFDRYGFGAGPNPLNLGAHSAFDNRMHMGQYGPKGTAFDKARGLGSPPTSEMPMLHNRETKNIGAKLGQDPVLLRSQSDEIFDALTPFLDSQYEIFEEVSNHPVTRQQRAVIESNVDEDAFARGRTPEQSTAVRQVVKEKGLDTEFALKFDFSKATATTNAGELVLKRNPFANRLTRLVLPSAGGAVLSATLGAQDLQAREAAVAEDPSFINKLQRDLTKTEIAADVVGAVPSPATPAAEVTGLGAGLTNLTIDVVRDPMGALQAVGGGIKYLADEFVLGVPSR
jgi:hypothetical protein